MRAERIIQASIFDMFAGHEIGRELKAMSQWLDGHPTLVRLVADDLRRRGVAETGRRGLPAELVLRCGLLKQHRQLSYEELAFHLEDSSSFRAFARLPLSWTPKKSVLHKTISAIRAETWEAINRTVLASAREEKLEPGKMVRLDSTVTAALMHEPSDSSLLWDGVRVMVRLLKAADALIGGAGVLWRDHRRAAKKRARSLPETALDDSKTVKSYKSLSLVEHAIRSIKTVDLHVRPVYHWLEDRVRAHVFLCMLAYYLEWHMRQRLAPMLYDDTDKEAAEALRKSPVAKAERSPAALAKQTTGRTDDGLPVHSFHTLLHDLATITKNTVATALAPDFPFTITTRPTHIQKKAFDLLGITCTQ